MYIFLGKLSVSNKSNHSGKISLIQKFMPSMIMKLKEHTYFKRSISKIVFDCFVLIIVFSEN